MFASFMKDTGIETMSEGDVYPRPRYTCPASLRLMRSMPVR